jgi:hypothetical protein
MAGFDEGPDSGELGWYRGHEARPLWAGLFRLREAMSTQLVRT